MSEEVKCQLDVCEKLFVKLSIYWRSAIFGLLTILSLGAGVWCWTWAEWKDIQKIQDMKIAEMQEAFNDVSYLRGQANEILENQKIIIKYLQKR